MHPPSGVLEHAAADRQRASDRPRPIAALDFGAACSARGPLCDLGTVGTRPHARHEARYVARVDRVEPTSAERRQEVSVEVGSVDVPRRRP